MVLTIDIVSMYINFVRIYYNIRLCSFEKARVNFLHTMFVSLICGIDYSTLLKAR